MQLSDDGQGLLTLRTRANGWLIALGALAIVVGALAAVVPGKARALEMHRWAPDNGAIELVEHSAWGTSRLVRIPLFMVASAEVVPGFIGGKERFSQLFLDVRDGEGIFYISWYGQAARAKADAAVINQFLRDPRVADARVLNDKRPWAWGFGALSAALGLVFLLWGSLGLTVWVDRNRAQLVVRRSGWLGTTTERLSLDQLREFKVAGLWGDGLLYAVLHSGRQVALTHSSDPEAHAGPRRVRAARLRDLATLQAFLAQPPQGGT